MAKAKKTEKKANPVGRPPLFKTAEELQAKVDEYFKSGIKKKTVIIGKGANKQKVQVPVPTITGLVLYLGFCDRQSFYDMEKIPKFTCTVKKARTFIETEYEMQLQVGNTVGAIFALKNMGWRDKVETVHEVGGSVADLVNDIWGKNGKLPIK